MNTEAGPFAHSSRSRLTTFDLGRFTADTLFDKLARAVCQAGCLPRKELYEAWEVARRVRRHFRGGRVVDMAGGHGLLAQTMMLLDDSSPEAVVVDRVVPPSASTLHHALVEVWPRLAGRVRFVEGDLGSVPLDAYDVVLSSHACGALTDTVLLLASDARARVAVLPCCHDFESCDPGVVSGWLDAPLAIDVTRASSLLARGYDVRTSTIPASITPKNRLLIGAPLTSASN